MSTQSTNECSEPKDGEREIKEKNGGGMNLTMIYCKNFDKCHHVPQYNNNMIMKKKPKGSNLRTKDKYIYFFYLYYFLLSFLKITYINCISII
jgi:hypothetical protein